MKRLQLEHIIRAASGITGAERFVVIGSQAVLGQFPTAPDELLISMEADLFTLRSPFDAELIDGSIGEASPFHRTFGYYARGIGEETEFYRRAGGIGSFRFTARIPGGGTGLCLEVHDLAVSKLIAGREKALDFIASLLRHQLASTEIIRERLTATSISTDLRQICESRLDRLSAGIL